MSKPPPPPSQPPTSPSPTFATPLPQSTRSSILEFRFPKPFSNYVLTGKSRAAWHTSFIVPQLNLLLDAGLCVNKSRPKHIFLTHGHSDHTFSATAFTKRDDPPDVFCPGEMVRVFDEFIRASRALNAGSVVDVAEQSEGDDTDDMEKEEEEEDVQRNGQENGDGTGTPVRLPTHRTYGLQPGDTVPLRRVKNISATAFACDHSVPCLGYVFSQTTHRLLPEHAHLSGPEIRDLRLAGTSVTGPCITPIFAFLGDTTAATLAAEPAWLRNGIPVVITECSFLYEEHRAQAEKTKHTIWADLEPVVRKWPKTVFVAMHFSLRYTDAMIAEFFKGLDDCPRNLVVWGDGEAE